MGLTALSGPFLSFGITQGSTGQVQEYNEERGPSLFDLGFGVEDPRYQFSYQPGSAVGTQVKSFFSNYASINFVPFATGSSAISCSSATTPTAGTALTLTPSTATGSFQTTIIAPETGVSTSVIAIDSTAAVLAFGQSGTVATWNPAAGAERKITLTPAGNSSQDGGTWTIAGRDLYGFKVSETIAVSSQVMTSHKTYKYISAITASTTLGSTGVGVGFNDTYGLPLLATYNSDDTQCRVNATSSATANPAQSNVAVVTGSTATATATSSGVRGTWASSVASNGTVRVQIRQRITENMVAAVTATDVSALFGVAQWSSF